MKNTCFFCCFFLLSLLLPLKALQAQCTTQVTHLTGTQQVGCREVTVTSSGAVGNWNSPCGAGPYLIGDNQTGSYTFDFSPAITSVRVNVVGINGGLLGFEEVAFYINGSFYPLTSPGVPIPACPHPAIISPTGTLQVCPGCNSNAGSWKDIVITENISTLTIEDIYISGAPASVTVSLYLCPTDAGMIPAYPFLVCAGNDATVPPASQTFFENDDLLQYILFSNLSDTLGSIIATSAIPSFAFNSATMQTDVAYYIAAIAGNNLNGNVDLTDPCLDISNAIGFAWKPLPTVAFTAANPNICAEACTTVTATFTGTAPFILTYSVPGGGPVTQTFSEDTGTFEVCSASNSAPGSLLMQATSLTDAWCNCQ